MSQPEAAKPEAGPAQTPGYAMMEAYPLIEPFAYAAVTRNPETGGLKYVLLEPQLSDEEKKNLERIRELLVEELDIDLKTLGSRGKAEEYLRKNIAKVMKDYKIKVSKESMEKVMYYISRDFIHMGRIEPFLRDHLIEDVSCDGVGVPLFIWHREYESIPTNVMFETTRELDTFVMKLAYASGRHISIATPMLDASLPDGSRIQLTYGTEVTRRGSTFSIRRFRADPLTVSDLMAFNTICSDMGAWFWYVIEQGGSILVLGGTATGKTTTLNCISMFIHPDSKVVSIEDTPELNLPHLNWVPSVARMGFGVTGSLAEISLFDLLRAAMRQRPDYIIVGEVRGEEAYTLFQAMATGHGGLSSMHAGGITAGLNRLRSEPMNIPSALVMNLSAIAFQSRVRLGERLTRRVTHVAEPIFNGGEIVLNDVFRWEPRKDSFTYTGKSEFLDEIVERRGITMESIMEELQRRKIVLEWMVKNRIRRYTDVGRVIREYYANPVRTYERARLGLTME